MIKGFPVAPDTRQRHAAQSPQHHLRRRLCRPASWLPRIDAFERGAYLLQIAPHDELHQHQHAQRDAQQADQRDDPLFVPQKQWGQRQGAPFQPPETVFDQVFAAIRSDALGQAQLLGGVIGRIDAPAQALHGLGEWRLLAGCTHTHALAAHRGRWTRTVATLNVLVDVGLHGDGDQPLNTMFGKDCGGGLVCRCFVGHARLALFAFIQRVEFADGARDTLAQALLLARGKGQRAHDQTAFLPCAGLPGLIRRAELDRVGKTHRHWGGRLIERPVSVRQADRAWGERVAQDGGEHAVEFRVRHLLGGERAQVVVLVRHDLRACAHSRHLAVTNVSQPGRPDGLADFGNLRQIERVIGRLASHDCRRQRQAERIEDRHGDLHLGQIGAMILAVPKLEYPFGRHVGRRRRGVDTYYAPLQVVDAQQGLIEFAFKCDPAVSDTQVVEGRRQPIIGQVAWFDLSAEAPTESTPMGFDPRLDAIKSVVALGEDKGQPHDRRPAKTQSLPIAIGREVVVQEFGYTHFLKVRDDGREVVYSFVGYCDFCAHPTSLTHFSVSRENSHELSVYALLRTI